MKNNSGLLVIIAVVLIAILGIVAYKATEKTPGEQMADSVSETMEDIGDAAQDAANN
jgi:hypothetical protein